MDTTLLSHPRDSEIEEIKSDEAGTAQAGTGITVAVTGASGFIASHCVKQLLDTGYNVRGTVRGDPSSDRYKWLHTLSPTSSQLELFQADLLKADSFRECFADCAYIFHVASPFQMEVKDAIKDLVQPAKQGTLNVLNCASKAGGRLKRIVLTSSQVTVNATGDSNTVVTFTVKTVYIFKFILECSSVIHGRGLEHNEQRDGQSVRLQQGTSGTDGVAVDARPPR